LNANGFDSHWVETSELLHGFEVFFSHETLLIAVSQSGESAEISDLMAHAGDFGHVIGITNQRHSALGAKPDTLLLLHAGDESSVSCKTYVASLVVLQWLSGQLLGSDPGESVGEWIEVERVIRQYLEEWSNHVKEILPFISGVRNIFLTGRGNSLAAAGTGGLILKESTRQHAEGMSSAAFRHGPLEMIGGDVLVFIFDGDEKIIPLQQRLFSDLIGLGGRAHRIGAELKIPKVFHLPQVSDGARSVLEILPIQMLSLAIAARDGIEAGRFEHASKITRVA